MGLSYKNAGDGCGKTSDDADEVEVRFVKPLDRFARKELRRQVEATVREARAIEDEGDHGASGADYAVFMHRQQGVEALGDLQVFAD